MDERNMFFVVIAHVEYASVFFEQWFFFVKRNRGPIPGLFFVIQQY